MEIVHPKTITEALAGLTEGVTPLAGGTDLMVEVNFGHAHPERVIGLRRLEELAHWEGDRIGAGVTWRRIERDGPTALAEAARTVGSPQIRNAGTIGGNLGTASPAGDGHPFLAAVDASIELVSLAGTRALRWDEFFTGVKKTARRDDELISAVRLPQELPETGVRQDRVPQCNGHRRGQLRRDSDRGRADHGGPWLGGPDTDSGETGRSDDLNDLEADLERPRRVPTARIRGGASDHRSSLHRGVSKTRGRGAGPPSSREVSAVIVGFTVNDEPVSVRVSHPGSLLDVLRDDLGLLGSKSACQQGECGSCSVILDGELVCSCLVMAADMEGSTVTSIEGVGAEGALHPVQEALHSAGAIQCGFCTPGFVVASVDLFERDPHPSPTEIREALAGNICRCTGYGAILRALEGLASGVDG